MHFNNAHFLNLNTSTRNTSTYTLEPKTSLLAILCAVSAMNFIIVITAVVVMSVSRNLHPVAPPLTHTPSLLET